ncbi:MAG: hypothetical protein EAZ59_22735 [Oscillatoriales cyanobacterium]|nr:MAG: hypothetical protein EAZ59_22735 [Oscillatoriales cyanobacterium]
MDGNTNFKKECNSSLVPPLDKGGLGGVKDCCTILEKIAHKNQLSRFNRQLLGENQMVKRNQIQQEHF